MINEIIINLIKESGLNQIDFSRKYKINYSTLNHIVNKESNASYKTLHKIVDRMNKKIKIEII